MNASRRRKHRKASSERTKTGRCFYLAEDVAAYRARHTFATVAAETMAAVNGQPAPAEPAPAADVAMISTAEAARRLGIKPHTLRVWRMNGRGPRFVRYGERASAAR